MRKAFKTYIPTYLQEWGILDAKGIPIESYNIKFVVGKDVPIQGHAYGDFFEVKDEDDVQYFVNEVCRQSKIVQKLCVRKIQERKQVKLDVLPVNGFDLNVSLFPNDYNNQTAILPKWQFNTFTDMPIPPLPPQPYIRKSHVEYHGILVGDEFCNKNECMYTIGVKSLREAFQYAVIKSCPQTYSVKCVQPDCQWNVYTRKVKDGNMFIVSNCKDIHNCSKTQINPNHRNATMKLLGNILLDKIRDSNRVYKVKDLQHDMRVDWKIDISYKRAWGGRNMALKILTGIHEDSFSQLPHYCYNLKLANEGTVTHILTDADGRFEMLYVGFRFAIISFLRYMRPLIIIDGAHLKGNHLGTNLLAIGMDGNNHILPLATGVSQGETGESWTWFLTKLEEQIGEPPNLCIISDRHAAIIQACAYTTEDFDKANSKLRGHRPIAVTKLKEAGIEKWYRAYFPTSRYNYITSNSVESINSLTKIVRRVPITMLVEYCRDLLQRWYCEKRHKYEEAPENELSNWAAAKVYDRMLKSAN
nr:transposase, MuDR, MULE transposase domain protein [Tanacetum cinerariifolium]